MVSQLHGTFQLCKTWTRTSVMSSFDFDTIRSVQKLFTLSLKSFFPAIFAMGFSRSDSELGNSYLNNVFLTATNQL